MASCQPKVPEVKYSDESWWQDFFTKDLAEFYASLQGLLNARDALIKELSGDLAQVLADPQRRDLALRVLFGGLDENCLEKIRQGGYVDCITHDKAAHLYKYVLGIGLEEWGCIGGYCYDKDLDERKRLLNLLKIKGFEEIGKEKLEVSIKIFDTSIMKYLSEMNNIVNKIKDVVQVREVQADYDLDLVKAFEDFLNKSIKLLPLYNPFTFFMQSLRSTPRPYLSIMYCEELFSDSVRNLMRKYGVELTKILDPGLTKSDELAVIGHVDGSVGKLIVELVQKIYDMTSKLSSYGYVDNEYWKYVEAKYNERTSTGSILGSVIKANSEYKKYCGEMSITKVEKGIVELHRPLEDSIRITYDKFLELFSPLMFLGIAWIEGNTLHVECR
ncbi:MAG: hypothetical protein RXO24_03340 [Acidilobus sp.]